MKCPCGSIKNFDECCEPLLKKQTHAETAEQLLRSRYTAFTQNDMNYLLSTHAPKTRSKLDLNETTQWARQSKWLGLQIINQYQGTDQKCQIEFKAHYQIGDTPPDVHHELSTFEKLNNRWFFVDGKDPKLNRPAQIKATASRNQLCPCGSGKKYKRCCEKT